MGYSSRVLAESWESNNLYYAALADEAGVPAGQLDAYVPEWNRAAIENIFATHLEDWPALLRSLEALAANVRQHGAQTVAMNEGGN
jgi:aspartate/glutamate racemase